MKLDKESNPLIPWRCFFNGVEITDGNWIEASEQEGYIIRYKILREQPDMPVWEPCGKDGKSAKCNWWHMPKFNGWMLSEDMHERVEGVVQLKLRSEAEVRSMFAAQKRLP